MRPLTEEASCAIGLAEWRQSRRRRSCPGSRCSTPLLMETPAGCVQETKAVFEKLYKFIGKNIKSLIDRPNEPYCFRLHKNKVYYVKEKLMKKATNVGTQRGDYRETEGYACVLWDGLSRSSRTWRQAEAASHRRAWHSGLPTHCDRRPLPLNCHIVLLRGRYTDCPGEAGGFGDMRGQANTQRQVPPYHRRPRHPRPTR